jgi:hypothetical protein
VASYVFGAPDVKLNWLLVAERRYDAVHHELLLRDGSQAARISPSAGPPQNLGMMLLYGQTAVI